MSPIVPVSLIVNFLAFLLPAIGIKVESAQLTDFVQVLITIVTSAVIYFQHNKVVGQAKLGGYSGR